MTASAKEEAISVEDLGRRFQTIQAVDGVSFEVPKGEIFGLVGPDGAGKTTVLRMLAGLVEPSSGRARVLDLDVSSEVAALQDRIGYMAQQFGLYVDLTVQENLNFYAELFGVPSDEGKERMERLLRMTRMEDFVGRPAGKLSGGMKQKLSLMCALLHEPDVLLLDEPTNGVDPISRREFWVILYQLVKRGMTVVVSTAYLDEAERCNEVALLYEGELIACDAPNRLVGHLREQCYRLRCSNPRRGREVLEEIEGVLSPLSAGSKVHFFASEEETEMDEIRRRLREEGISDIEIDKITPGVEDVFIALVNKEGLREKAGA